MNLAKRSLFEAKQDSFYSLLVHNSDALNYENADEIVAAFEECKRLELTERIGVSCYEASDLITISSMCESFSEFQMPENLMDQRNFSNPRLQIMKDSGKSIQVRSIFLQGLLLKNLKYKNLKFNRFTKIWTALHNWLYNNKYNLLDVCINDCLRYNFDSIIIGFENLNHLKRIINYK